jgi:outer membrane protein W
MVKHVTLKQSEEGWTATVATAHQMGDNLIAMGETLVHPNKESAWNTIENEVQNLDYENDTIIFNGLAAKSFTEIDDLVNEM